MFYLDLVSARIARPMALARFSGGPPQIARSPNFERLLTFHDVIYGLLLAPSRGSSAELESRTQEVSCSVGD